MSEQWRLRRCEGYGACDDVVTRTGFEPMLTAWPLLKRSFNGERNRSEMSEQWRLRRCEGYGACDDVVTRTGFEPMLTA